MTFGQQTRVPRAPTLPAGEPVASYASYLEAQKAVDHLSDQHFPVQLVTIVGSDLRLVERVTGRLSYPRVAVAGLASGAWFGLAIGLLLSLFATSDSSSALPILPAILIGAGFGMLFSVISYSFTGGRRDFTSASQIVAGRYTVLCAVEQAHQARQLLQEVGGVVRGGGEVPPGPTPSAQPGPTPPAQPGPTSPIQPGQYGQPGPTTPPEPPTYR